MKEVVGIVYVALEGPGRSTPAGAGADVIRLPARVAVREPRAGATRPLR